MLIDSVPEILRPLQYPMAYLGNQVRWGLEFMTFAHPTDVLWVRSQEDTWVLSIGPYQDMTLPRTQAPTPEGVLADLAHVFGAHHVQGLQMLIDAITWQMMQEGRDNWHMFVSQRVLVAASHGKTRILHMTGPLDDLLSAHQHVLLPRRQGSIPAVFAPLGMLSGAPPATHHGRVGLHQRVMSGGIPGFPEPPPSGLADAVGP